MTEVNGRIEELESVRGLAALLIVFFHLPGWNPFFYNIHFIRNADLMVELFFVLSGFVIYTAYSDNIKTTQQLFRFQFLRFGRLYPVHIVFLVCFLLVEILKFVAEYNHLLTLEKTPFEKNSGLAFLQQLFLVQGIVPSGLQTFNRPAWSISVEFYTYLLFGAITLCAYRLRLVIFFLLGFISFCILALNLGYGYHGLLRGIAGFFMGCIVATISNGRLLIHSRYGVFAFLAIIIFLQFKERHVFDVGIYILASILILCLALSSKGGLLNRLLRLQPLTWLGRCSYSIYMSHSFFIYVFDRILTRRVNYPYSIINGESVIQLTVIESMLCYPLLIASVLAASHIIYNVVEKPYREKSRLRAAKI